MRRALAKAHPRIVAVDDGAFERTDRRAPIAAVVVSVPSYVESVRTGSVRVDGRDATRRIRALIRATGAREGLRAILLDGAVVGGFNVIDLDELHRAFGVPVIAVTRRRPEFSKIRAALTKWFPRDAERRLRALTRHRLFPVGTAGRPIHAAAVGCTRADAATLVRRTAVRGYWPEPLRLAHLVASAGEGPTPPARARPRRPRGPTSRAGRPREAGGGGARSGRSIKPRAVVRGSGL